MRPLTFYFFCLQTMEMLPGSIAWVDHSSACFYCMVLLHTWLYLMSLSVVVTYSVNRKWFRLSIYVLAALGGSLSTVQKGVKSCIVSYSWSNCSSFLFWYLFRQLSAWDPFLKFLWPTLLAERWSSWRRSAISLQYSWPQVILVAYCVSSLRWCHLLTTSSGWSCELLNWSLAI